MTNLSNTTGFFEGERTFKTIFDYVVSFDEVSNISWCDSNNEFQLFSMQPTDLSLLVGAFDENYKDTETSSFFADEFIEIESTYGVSVKLFPSGWFEISYEDEGETKLAKSTIEEIKSIYGAYKQMKAEQIEFEILRQKLEKRDVQDMKTVRKIPTRKVMPFNEGVGASRVGDEIKTSKRMSYRDVHIGDFPNYITTM